MDILGDALDVCRNDVLLADCSMLTGTDDFLIDDAGEYVDFDPSFANIDGPFTATINDYLSKELNAKLDALK